MLHEPGRGIIWITGASSGVGRAVTIELVRRGFSVAATSNAPTDLSALAASFPGRIHAFPGDIGDASAMRALVDAIEAAHGPIALAFLNAGGQFGDDPAHFDAGVMQRTIHLNVVGTANCLSPLLANMRARGRGQIVINGSSSGYGGLPEAVAYGASKAALIHLAESLHLICKPLGVSVRLVTLGFVRTPLTDLNAFPMPFLMTPEQAARRICDGFAGRSFEIVVPRRLIWMLKALRLLPKEAYFAAIRAVTSQKARRLPVLRYPPDRRS